jgi:hypothetical protein
MFILRNQNDRFLSGGIRFSLILEFVLLTMLALPGSSDAGVQIIENEVTPNHVEVPGTGASFVTPDDFFLADRFDGFDAKGRTINVIVVVIKSPFQGIVNGFTDASLKQRGIEVHSRGEALINGSRALFIKALHPDGGKKWGKWIMLVENGDDTIVVNGAFVSGDAAAAADVIKMMKSIAVKRAVPVKAPEDIAEPAASGNASLGQTDAASDDLSGLQRIVSPSGDLTAADGNGVSGDLAGTLSVQQEDQPVALPHAEASPDLTEKERTDEQEPISDLVMPMTSADNPEAGGEGATTMSRDIKDMR